MRRNIFYIFEMISMDILCIASGKAVVRAADHSSGL